MALQQQILFNFDEVPEEPIVAVEPVRTLKPPAQLLQTLEPEKPALMPTKTGKKRGRPAIDPSLKKKKQPAKRGRKSLKDSAAEADLIEIPEDDVLFSKKYYSMKEVTTMFHTTHSQIRLWETEFHILRPKKNKKGDRHFRPEDVKNLKLIHHLVRERKYTIAGAKAYLKNAKQVDAKFDLIQSLQKVRGFLLEIKANL